MAYSQDRVAVPKSLQDISIQYDHYLKGDHAAVLENAPLKQSPFPWYSVDESYVGDTRYDNQSNASIPKKIYAFDDGTIGATWTRSMEEGSFFADRGTGYNYFNGQEWGDWPTDRVEDIKVHRPAYAPWGENGELIVSHTSGTGLYLATREQKGSGDWEFHDLPGPAGNEYTLWCRVVTSGLDNNRIHLLALTLPESHGGQPYEGLNGALLYSLSTDGGESWEIENEILDGMTSDEYSGFPGDTYAFAEPKGDVVAFVVGEPWTGLFLMKSTDGGVTFEKTHIWNHPYPNWELGMAADTFFCADGSHSLVIDSQGKVHVAFGISRVEADSDGTYWYPWVDGIAYWNEDMLPYSENLHALDPNTSHPDSELQEDYTLIGWTQDINNNGELDFTDDLGLYFIGLSSMPQLAMSEWDQLFLVYASTTETYDNGLKNYRHIWFRPQSGDFWGEFLQLTNELVHIFDECVYPAVAANVYDGIHLIYQFDTEPGTAVWAAQHEYVNNTISYIKVSFPVGINEQAAGMTNLSVLSCYPNPTSGETSIRFDMMASGRINLVISAATGQQVLHETYENLHAGSHLISIDAAAFSKGIYFYTLSDGQASITQKLVVD